MVSFVSQQQQVRWTRHRHGKRFVSSLFGICSRRVVVIGAHSKQITPPKNDLRLPSRQARSQRCLGRRRPGLRRSVGRQALLKQSRKHLTQCTLPGRRAENKPPDEKLVAAASG